jgi:hypothetical protein
MRVLIKGVGLLYYFQLRDRVNRLNALIRIQGENNSQKSNAFSCVINHYLTQARLLTYVYL